MISVEKNKGVTESEKKVIEIPENITVKDLADKMEIKVSGLITELIKNKIFANINETIDFDTAAIIADDFGFELVKAKLEIEKRRDQLKKSLGPKAKKRPPVVVIMGHVDHGKTTLLDQILKTNIASKEFGGITQHVSAYQVKHKKEVITFLDTPGHEAFQAMRQRGAYITDLAVIVVAADDGVKPQTVEAVNFAKSAGIPIIVAINKVDKPEANIDKVKGGLAEIGLMSEDWGGNTICVNISAKTGEGIDGLLDMIILTSEIEELKADINANAEGFVIESHINSSSGPVATVLLQNGTLNEGDYVSVGSTWGKVRRMEDFIGKKIKKALPSMPVVIMGLNDVPKAGSFLRAEKSRVLVEGIADKFSRIQTEKGEGSRMFSNAKIKELVKSNKVKKLNIILKADVKGSLEAIVQILESIKSEEVVVQILKMGVGNITETDIRMAHSSGAKVIGFNIDSDSSIKKFAEKEKVDIRVYRVIYELISDIKKDLSAILEPETVRTDLGKLKTIAIFKSGKKSAKVANMIIGAKVEYGRVEKNCLIDVSRNGQKIGQGIIKELQYNKKVVEEVKAGNNAGMTYEGNVVIEDGDVLDAYKEEKVKREV